MACGGAVEQTGYTNCLAGFRRKIDVDPGRHETLLLHLKLFLPCDRAWRRLNLTDQIGSAAVGVSSVNNS
jgi:hypothetical protein